MPLFDFAWCLSVLWGDFLCPTLLIEICNAHFIQCIPCHLPWVFQCWALPRGGSASSWTSVRRHKLFNVLIIVFYTIWVYCSTSLLFISITAFMSCSPFKLGCSQASIYCSLDQGVTVAMLSTAISWLDYIADVIVNCLLGCCL